MIGSLNSFTAESIKQSARNNGTNAACLHHNQHTTAINLSTRRTLHHRRRRHMRSSPRQPFSPADPINTVTLLESGPDEGDDIDFNSTDPQALGIDGGSFDWVHRSAVLSKRLLMVGQ